MEQWTRFTAQLRWPTTPSGDPGYPYEKLTSVEVAHVQRLRDEQMAQLHQENNRLRNKLYFTEQRLNQILPLLEEMGIDIDIMLTTKEVFKESSPSGGGGYNR